MRERDMSEVLACSAIRSDCPAVAKAVNVVMKPSVIAIMETMNPTPMARPESVTRVRVGRRSRFRSAPRAQGA